MRSGSKKRSRSREMSARTFTAFQMSPNGPIALDRFSSLVLASHGRPFLTRRLTTKTCPIPYSRFQPFFSVSTQISPVLEMFGWKILVIIVPESGRRETEGGCAGESGESRRRNGVRPLELPGWNHVPCVARSRASRGETVPRRDSHFGGAFGKSVSAKSNRTRKYPPAYGVPARCEQAGQNERSWVSTKFSRRSYWAAP